MYKQLCDNRVFVGNLWAERERERERVRKRERQREAEVDRGRGRERERERQREGEEEEKGGGRVLWALGGNLCLASEGWGSYNHPFVTSGKI